MRTITICGCIICFITYAMYYGPVLIIADIGFDIYISSILIQASEMVCFIPSYFYIERMPRQKLGVVMFALAGICSGILIFVTKPKDCDLCVESIIEIAIITIFRFAISFYFCFFQIYTI